MKRNELVFSKTLYNDLFEAQWCSVSLCFLYIMHTTHPLLAEFIKCFILNRQYIRMQIVETISMVLVSGTPL